MSAWVALLFLLASPSRLTLLEERLLQARGVDIDFDLRAEGAFSAELHGRMTMRAGGTLQMQAEGSFGEQQARLSWQAAEGFCRGLRDDRELYRVETPFLDEAILLGLTRMGILHNLARFFSESPPDHADSGIGDWLMVQNESSQGDSIRFDLDVSGQRAATIALTLDADGLPLRRLQRVEFPGGVMSVREDYHFEISDRQRLCPACRQELTGFGRENYVEMDWSRIFVCCIDCAERVEHDFGGYQEILTGLGDDTERLQARRTRPLRHLATNPAPCAGCQAGLCAQPEYQPAP